MFLIGLTGGIASGKSTVSKIFQQEYKIPVVDADVIAHQVVEPNRKGWHRIKKHFDSDDVFNTDGTLNRDKLGQIIFSDAKKRRLLNKCLHNLIVFEIIKQIFLYFIKGYRYIIIDVPLLFEFKAALKLISYKVVVVCNEEEQLRRLLERNQTLTETDAKLRIESQMKNSDRIKLADYSIDNSNDLKETREQIKKLNRVFETSKRYLPIRIGLAFIFCAGAYILFRIFK